MVLGTGISRGLSRRGMLCAASAGVALSRRAQAQAQASFPSRPIEVVTHTSPGGGTDITARMMMVQAPAEFGTEFSVATRSGGSGASSIAYVASRPKDGHTLLLVTQSHLLVMIRNRTPTQFEDLVAVARATEDPQIVFVRRDNPARTLAELITQGKARSLRFGITNVAGTDHVSTYGFARAAGMQPPSVVPFRGGGEVLTNLIGGNVDACLSNYAEAEAQLRAGELRPLAVLAERRVETLGDVPTGREAGVPVVYSTVRGFMVMKGTPEDRIARLESGLVKAMEGPLYRNYLANSGQSSDSVAGRQVWQTQLDAMWSGSRAALEGLGLLR
jgi:tripartite-type tricarboxylate transporter receptor subunit TctC